MRVMIAGGRRLGEECLRWLLHRGEDVVAVIPNKGEQFSILESVGVPVIGVDNINSEDSARAIEFYSPDVIFSLYFHQIYKERIISIPPKGIINMHLALAEEYRGCYSSAHCILNGETRTGVTMHMVESGIDTGKIIATVEVPISKQMTGGDVQEACIDTAIMLFKAMYDPIKLGKAIGRPQNASGKMKYYPRVFPPREIDFNQSGHKVLRQIRAVTYPPHEPAHFFLGNKKFVIVEEKYLDKEKYGL